MSILWLLLGLLLPALGLTAGAALWLVRTAQPPIVKLTAVTPDRLTRDSQTLRVSLRIHNANPWPLPLKAIRFRLALEGEAIAAGEGACRQRIPARGQAEMHLTITGDARLLARVLPWLAFKRQPWHYDIEGTLILPLLPPVPYRQAGEIDAKGLLRLAASLR
jgi:hypothetical protein